FYTPSKPEQRLHRMILDPRTKIKIDEIKNNDINQGIHMDDLETCNNLFNQLLFNEKQISSIHTIDYQIYNGLLLNKLLISHDNLRNVNLVLQTIDDLYILLDGLVPNVQTTRTHK
ncbi:unnamed protein product, partial [Rotaria sp. Silwood2]